MELIWNQCLFVVILCINTSEESNGTRVVLSPMLNWTMAVRECEMDNQKLIDIKRADNFTLITEELLGTVNRSFWIGLRFVSKRNQFLWLDGMESDVSYWEEGQPSFVGDRPCIKMTCPGCLWSPTECNQELGYICSDVPLPSTQITQVSEKYDPESRWDVLAGYLILVVILAIVVILASYQCLKVAKPTTLILPTKPLKIQHRPS